MDSREKKEKKEKKVKKEKVSSNLKRDTYDIV
jgi:hypothetical protein